MTVGICLLAHAGLHRVCSLALFLADQGLPVALHVDSAASDEQFDILRRRLEAHPDIIVMPRLRTEWGTFRLLEASLNAAEALLSRYPDLGHVSLISGGCLPVRPIAELKDFLARNPGVDFVESHHVGQVNWVKGGLDQERFTLYHPFGWRSKRWLFDSSVITQRALGVRRRIPKHITPHIGSQWWTLSRDTLLKILNDPNRDATDAYFRRCWIPDEGYVQSLVRNHSTDLRCESLTLSEFDPQGKPFMFYDDHLEMLRNSGKFFARKIWTGAEGLYSFFLGNQAHPPVAEAEDAPALPTILEAARQKRSVMRKGVVNQASFPAKAHAKQHPTAREYCVFDGFDFLFPDFDAWLRQNLDGRVHGRLFTPDDVEFENGAPIFRGGLPASTAIRDWNPEQFLTRLIWNDRDMRQLFFFHAADNPRMSQFMVRDPNARIFMIEGAWVLALAQSLGEDERAFRTRALRLKLLEEKRLADMALKSAKAEIYRWRLQDVMDTPFEVLNQIQKLGRSDPPPVFTVMPKMQIKIDLEALHSRLTGLDLHVPELQAVVERDQNLQLDIQVERA